MGYKFLGFVVWQGLRLYLRRRVSGGTSKLVIAGAAGGAGLLVAGAAVAARRARSTD